jgi:hypothetical protein
MLSLAHSGSANAIKIDSATRHLSLNAPSSPTVEQFDLVGTWDQFKRAYKCFARAHTGFARAHTGFARAHTGFARAHTGFARAHTGFARAHKCFARALLIWPFGIQGSPWIVKVSPMSVARFNSLRETIRATLERHAGSLSGTNATSHATAATWRLIETQLVPVIGARGLDVLFRRALHQTITAFPWLAASVDRGGSAGPLPSLMACLATQHTATAAEAVSALLLTFAELLATLIGDSLTERLLAPVWARPSLSSDPETPP